MIRKGIKNNYVKMLKGCIGKCSQHGKKDKECKERCIIVTKIQSIGN
jgi:hypothetical protein